MGDQTYRKVACPFTYFYLDRYIHISSKLTCMVGRMSQGFYSLIEIELKMLKIPHITNLKAIENHQFLSDMIMMIGHNNFTFWVQHVQSVPFYSMDTMRSKVILD